MAYQDFNVRNDSRNNNNNSSNYRHNNGGNKKKHSGADKGVYTTKDGRTAPWVNGWHYSRRDGMIKYFASRYKGTHMVKSKSGKSWESWILRITVGNNLPQIMPCMYCVETGKVICKDLSLVINPSAPNGGYTGTFVNSK